MTCRISITPGLHQPLCQCMSVVHLLQSDGDLDLHGATGLVHRHHEASATRAIFRCATIFSENYCIKKNESNGLSITFPIKGPKCLLF